MKNRCYVRIGRLQKIYYRMASIKRNFIYNLLLQVSKVIFPLITAPYVARILDPDGVGIFNFVNTYSSYFALFAVLGIPTYGIREIAKRRDDLKACELFVSQMISIEVISTLLVSVIYIGSVFSIGQLNENAMMFLVAGISLYISPFKIEWFFSGREEFGYITFRSLVIKTISVVLLFIVVRDKGDLLNYIVLNLFATIVNEFWNYVKLFKLGIRPRLTLRGTKEHLKPVLILFGSSVAVSIYVMLDTLMLGFFSSYDEVGYYNSAMHVVKALLPIATALSTVAIPRVSIYMKDSDISMINKLMTQSLGIVSLLAFPLMIGVIVIAPEFVPLFYGDEFHGTILPMQIGAGVIVAIGLNNLNGIQILTGMAKDKQFLISVCAGAVINFILNLALIPRYGASGAALASVIAEIIIFIINEYFVRKCTQVRMQTYSDLMKAVAGALLFIPVSCLCSRFLGGWTYIIVCFLFCALIYIFAQKIFKNSMYFTIYNLFKSKLTKRT